MHNTGYALAIMVGGGIAAAVGTAGDYFFPGVGIEVHNLEFVQTPEPAIMQHRTVTAKNALTARWQAEIRADGVPLDVCSGAGTWDYSAGEKRPVLPVDEWTGRDGCWAAIPEGVLLQACAKYTWGDGQVATQCTLGFRKTQ